MFKSILVPIDLADTDLAKPAIATAATLSQTWSGTVRLLNVLPMTPVMLAEYVPADFDAQQRQTSEEALAIVARESGIDSQLISSVVRQGGIYHEILEEAAAVKADLIVMTSHRPAMRTYFLGSNAGHVVRYANARCWWCGTDRRHPDPRQQLWCHRQFICHPRCGNRQSSDRRWSWRTAHAPAHRSAAGIE